MTCPAEVKEWLKILIPLFALGGIGGVGLEQRSAERYGDNEDYVSQVSIEFLEFELLYSEQIGALKERIARLEGTHETD